MSQNTQGGEASPPSIRVTSPNGHARIGKTTDGVSLAHAIEAFEAALPGWWWSVGTCSISRDASCGPDRNGCDARLLFLDDQDALRLFDNGFHADLDDPDATVADALKHVMEQAIAAKQTHGTGPHTFPDGRQA